MKFTKMQGAGNDFVVFEDIENKYNNLNSLAKKLCDRRFGIGADGILVLRKCKEADVEMIIINADGSYASMCGNGIRCFAKFAYENGYVNKENMTIKTVDGIKGAELIFNNDKEVIGVKINMGMPSFNPIDFKCTLNTEIINYDIKANNKSYKINTLLMGVPHTVIIGKLDEYDINEGKEIEKYEIFKEGTNVNFCEIIDRNNISVKTWERGAGPTLACGTGSCASVVISNKLGFIDKACKVTIPGGELFIEIKECGIMMTGPAENVFEGNVKI